MDTARITAELLRDHGINAATYIENLTDLPLVHVTQTRGEANDLFGLDTLTLTGYAPNRSAALAVVSDAIALADGRAVFSPGRGLIDRLERMSPPVPMSFHDDLMTATAEITAEYRL